MKRTLLLALLLIPLVGCDMELDKKPIDMKVMYPVGGKGDFSFADSVHAGVVFGRWQLDVSLEEHEPTSVDDANARLDAWFSEFEDGTLIVTVGAPYNEYLAARDCEFNGHRVLHLDSEVPTCRNLRSVVYRVFAPSFLAGVAAVEASPNKQVAAIGGMQLPEVVEFIDGYAAGVEYAGGELVRIEYLSDDFDGFNDIEGAMTLANEMYDQGIDVILPVAGRSSLGVIDAALAYDSRDVYSIGVDSDQTALGARVVLGSVLKRLDRGVREAMFEVSNGEFAAGIQTVGMGDGSTEFILNPIFTEFQAAVDAAAGPAEEAAATYYRRP